MTAKLLVREVNAREFTQHAADYLDDAPDTSGVDAASAVEKATVQGERLCRDGNVEEFQVWTLTLAKRRVWALEDAQ